MRPEVDVYAYVQDLEKHLQLTLFGGGMADPEGAVLLIRGALADGDRDRAAALARQTQRLAMITPGDPDMTAAADHARGLTEQDPAALQRAAGRYTAARARHHLPGPVGADRRGAGRRGCLVAVSPAGSREAVAGVGPERVPLAEPSVASVFLVFLA